ncbi:MAG: nitroreductase family protein [Rikenellaceae bacterium]
MEKLIELVERTRSVRRFDQTKKVDIRQLHYMVEVARLTASARNSQPLKYVTVTNAALCEQLLRATGWAASLPDGKPKEGEKPTGYILILHDKTISQNSLWDQGIVSYTMMLAASEQGLGGCIIATIYRDKMPDLGLPDHLEPVLILGVGYPCEDIRIVGVSDGATKYYRDAQGTHYVPKRDLSDLLVKEIE